MADNKYQNDLGLAVPKNRPTDLFDSFKNRASVYKKASQKSRTSRDSKSVTDSSSSISLAEQFRYLQLQHKEAIEKYNALKQDYITLYDRHNQLMGEYTKLKESYDELQENHNNLLESQKSFNAGKLLVFLKLKRRTDKETLEKRKIIQNEACFNTYLEDVIMDDEVGIPRILVECVTIVESSEKFMKSPGLYRVSGNHNTIQNLRYDINDNNYKKLRKQKSPHEVCGVLKLFLRELKEPIISLAQLRQIIPGPSEMIHTRMLKVLELVHSLDELRRKVLQFLIKHLTKVVSTEENEMDGMSLGILMSSCIFNETLTDVCPERFETMSAVPRECVRTMIENYNDIFDK